jgi:hypothetical protein
MAIASAANRFNGLLHETVKTVNQISPISITALKCGANEIFKRTHYLNAAVLYPTTSFAILKTPLPDP